MSREVWGCSSPLHQPGSFNTCPVGVCIAFGFHLIRVIRWKSFWVLYNMLMLKCLLKIGIVVE